MKILGGRYFLIGGHKKGHKKGITTVALLIIKLKWCFVCSYFLIFSGADVTLLEKLVSECPQVLKEQIAKVTLYPLFF